MDINYIDSEHEMNELGKEIVAVIDKLDKSNPVDGSTEYITTSHLKGLVAAMETAVDLRTLEPRYADLEQFWLSSVAWCSELSRDIEKIIIIFREQL